MKKCLILLITVSLITAGDTIAQNLHFTFPALLLPDAATDKAVSITNFNGGYFITWKAPGNNAAVNYSYLGKHYDTTSDHHGETIPGAKTNFAPVLRVSNKRIYLFWITTDRTLNYIVNRTDTAFATDKIYTLSFPGNQKLSSGITTAAVGDHVLIASHTTDRQQMVYILTAPAPDGLFPEAELKPIPGHGSTDYPFVVAISDTAARFCWKGYKDQAIYCADLAITTNQWKAPFKLGSSRSGVSPAIYRVWKSQRLFYVWSPPGKDNRLSYTTDSVSNIPAREIRLPVYFASGKPVAICHVDNNNFLLAFTRDDGRIYISKFANYNPASWMQDILLPEKGTYTLKDIVIPGAHDAGMSVLNGVGGSQSGTINECNTLTQRKGIAGQLNAGIRMFDLRVGTYKDTLYAKHCSSDCMADAIGGGYGERLDIILHSIRNFLLTNKGEIVLLTFSHFCERETPVNVLAEKILNGLGKDLVYQNTGAALSSIPLKTLAGKVIVTFEHYSRPDHSIDSCTIADNSHAFINFRREYAATNNVDKFLQRQELFFRNLSDGVRDNDLVRLDWQLTQSSDEAAMICNDFQNENTNPLVDGVMVLTNALRKHKSIIDLSLAGNKYLPVSVNGWIDKDVITVRNKPNILYVDVAGEWITDYCVDLNQTMLYKK